MRVKFFATFRDYTLCKETDFPYQHDMYSLLHALSDHFGSDFRKKALSPDGQEIGSETIVMVNGRHVQHLGGIHTTLVPEDIVAIFPVVAGG